MPRFALTFDDGPGPSTAALLDVLRDAGARATFFLLGRNVVEAPWCGGDVARTRALALRVLREGHIAGNHSYSHLKPERWREVALDLRRGEQVVRDLRRELGMPEAAVPVRLPYGIRLIEQTINAPAGTLNAVALDPRVPVLASMGLAHLHWTSDFDDWTLQAGDGAALSARMAEHIERNAALGLDAVLDLHDSGTGSSFGYQREATVEGVRLLLRTAAERGWEIFTIPAG
jgi:peptidoglycan/xylan/chitin deacetylase (PgdA/CDA1 family)